MDKVLAHYDKNKPLLMSSDIFLGAIEAAEKQGISLQPSMQACGVHEKWLHPPESFVPIHTVVDFFNDVAERNRCEHFGFLTGVEQPPHRFSHVGRLMKFAPTLGVAIRDGMDLSLLNSEFSRWELNVEGEYASLIRRTRVALSAPMSQLQTLAVTLVFKSLLALVGQQVQVHQICFSHGSNDYHRKMEAFFRAPVLFNQSYNGIVFPAATLAVELPSADQELYQLLLDQLRVKAEVYKEFDNVVSKVVFQIRSTMGTSKCNFDTISQRLAMHPRTLQRQLAEHGVHFKGLLNEIRHQQAEEFLRTSSVSILELSELLGYQNASAFSRAFKNISGMSPAKWQALNR